MGTFRFRSRPLICVGLLFLTVGCAPAYHAYRSECSCVPYDYCPPAPLPYTTYCGCPTQMASGCVTDLPAPPAAPEAKSTDRNATASP